MKKENDDIVESILTYLSIVTLAIVGLVMIGWYRDIPLLTDLGYSGSSMKINTGLCFGLLAGLTLLKDKPIVWLKTTLLLFLALLSVGSIFQHATGVDLFINEMLVKDNYTTGGIPGLMSLGTALSFLLLALHFLALKSSLARDIKQYLIHTITLIAVLSVLEYFFSIEFEYRVAFISSMAIHTSLLFFLFSLFISLTENRGLTPLLRGRKPGSVLARKMFVLMLATALIIGYTVIQMIKSGNVSSFSGVALAVVIMTALSLVYVSLIAFELNRTDDVRQSAQDQLVINNEDLSRKVSDKTRELKGTIDLLNETNRVAKVGGWEVDFSDGKMIWTTITKAIYEIPHGSQPNFEEGLEYFKEGKDREQMAKAVNDALSLGFSWDLELMIVTAKGNFKWVRTIGKPTFENAKCLKINGTLQDITTRKHAEVMAQEERKFLQTIIDNVPVNIYAKDLDSRKTLVNKSELAQMGMENPEEVLGKTDAELFPEESAQQSREEDLKVFESGEPMLGVETKMVLESGETTWYLTSKIPIRDSDGFITGLLGVSVDITNRKLDEDRLKNYAILEAKSKEMEQFAYIASHDLREPLSTVQNYLKVLFEENEEQFDEEAIQFKGVIDRGLDRMNNLILGLLDYSRLSSPKESFQISIEEIIEEVKSDLNHQIEVKGAKIEYQNLPFVLGYKLEIKLLFQNLISNALKFSKDGVTPEIIISAKPMRSGFMFAVKDNGIGIAPTDLEKVFGIFRKLHRRDEYPGTGIGLAHARKIVELHNGKIWVESDIGKGSCFYLTLNLT